MVDELTEHEAAIYDRQLRVWGVETQKRLSKSRVLIAGCTGLAAEVAKNIVLAGLGSVTLVDDTPCSLRPASNFLIPADAPADMTVARACVATLQEMNPYVQVSALPGTPVAALAPETLRQSDLLLLCGQPADIIVQADELCREAGVAFFAGVCRGPFGWAFADLQEHQYSVESSQEQEDGSTVKVREERTRSYPSWRHATRCSLAGANLKKMSKLYLVLRVFERFEEQQERFAASADLGTLVELRKQVCEEAGIDPAMVPFAVPDSQMAAYADAQGDMPAINAVVGGVLANEVIRAAGGGRGQPAVNNFFLFSLFEGTGAVETMG